MFCLILLYTFRTIGLDDAVSYSIISGNEPVPFSTISNTIANDDDTASISASVAISEEVNGLILPTYILFSVFLTKSGDTSNPPLIIVCINPNDADIDELNSVYATDDVIGDILPTIMFSAVFGISVGITSTPLEIISTTIANDAEMD